MQKRMRSLMVMLLVFVMAISHMTVVRVRAEDLPADSQKVEVVLSKEKKQELGIIQTKDIYEYSDALKNLNASFEKRKTSLNGSKNECTDLCRAMVKGTPLFDGFSPLTIIETPYGQYVVQFATQKEAEEFVNSQKDVKSVEWAELEQAIVVDNQKLEGSYQPEDDGHLGCWGTDCIEAKQMVEYLKEKINNGEISNEEIIVAVIDSGVESTHDFLKDHITHTTEGYSFVDESDGYYDTFGHGTHIAGTIVDCTLGLNITILSIKVGDEKFKCTDAAIRMAADKGAAIINCSFGGKFHAQSEVEAVKYAIDKGCIVCAAAGNEREDCSPYAPAGVPYPGVICVSAIQNENGNLSYASFSNYGEKVDVAMPGVDIISSFPGNSYKSWKGTSMATPHASASAALIKMLYRDITPGDVETIMKYTTRDIGASGFDIFYGYGVIDFSRLIDYDKHRDDISIISQPSSVTTELGHAARFCIDAENVLRYNWQRRDDSNSEWETIDEMDNGQSVLALIGTEYNDDNQYRCELFGLTGIVYSNVVTLSVIYQESSNILDSGICGDGMSWQVIGNILYILGEDRMYDYCRGSAPWYLWRDTIEYIVFLADGDGETIGDYAFADFVNLKAIVDNLDDLYNGNNRSYLHKTINSIGTGAFYNCRQLSSIEMPMDLNCLGAYSFANCSRLTNVSFKEGLETIEECVFISCLLKDDRIYVPESLISVSEDTFFLSNIESVFYEGSYDEWNERIGQLHFNGRKDVQIYYKFAPNLYFGFGIDEHGYNTLYLSGVGDVPDLGSFDEYPWHVLSDIFVVNISGGITGIFGNIFKKYDLYQVFLPYSMCEIGENVFGNDDYMEVYYDGTVYGEWEELVKHIDQGNDGLLNCNLYLKCGPNTYWQKNNSVIKIVGTGWISDQSINVFGDYKDEIEIIDLRGYFSVPYKAFEGFDRIKLVIIDGGIDMIDEDAFKGCDNIKDLYISDEFDWDTCQIFDGNESLFVANIHDYTNGDVIILKQPNDVEVIAGHIAIYNCSFYCSNRYKCQWYRIDKEGHRTRIEGSISDTLIVEATSETDGNCYQLSIQSRRTNKTSIVKLYVSSTKPVIRTSWKDLSRVGISGQVGQSVTINVDATGGGLHYQWQKYKPSTGWINIEGNDDKSLAVVIEEGDNGAKYRCVVSNMLGTATSSSWKVMIIRQVDPGIIKPPVEKKEKLPHNFVNQLQLVSRIPS